MGFFNFHKKTELLAPMTGRVIPLEKVPDAVFSQKTLGEGAAIMPEDGLVTAPCDGTIAYVPDTKHAIALTSTKGVEVLIHVGIDTVSLQGEGFDALVKEGDSVSRGQGLLQGSACCRFRPQASERGNLRAARPLRRRRDSQGSWPLPCRLFRRCMGKHLLPFPRHPRTLLWGSGSGTEQTR